MQTGSIEGVAVYSISLQHAAKHSRPSILSPQTVSAVAAVITTFIFSMSYKFGILSPSGLSHALGFRTVARKDAVHSGIPCVLNKNSRAFPQSSRGKYRDTFST